MKIDWTSPSCSPSPRVTHWAGDTPTILVLCREGVDSVKVVKEVKNVKTLMPTKAMGVGCADVPARNAMQIYTD